MKSEYLGVASVNGKISDLSKAKIPLSDRGFLFGHSIFETLLIKNGRIISWQFHFERMKLSCKKALIKLPEENKLLNLCLDIVQENIKRSKIKSEKSQLRIIISGGNSFNLPLNINNNMSTQSNIIIICRNVSGPSKEEYLNGIKVKSIPDLRSPGLIEIKSCSYLYNLIALEMAHQEGYDEAIFYNDKNVITESTTSNFIWFDKDFMLKSTTFQGNCLAGVTLSRLISGLERMSMRFEWGELSRTNLSSVDGCGIISSIRGVIPIKQIDDYQYDVFKYRFFFEKLNQIIQFEENESS